MEDHISKEEASKDDEFPPEILLQNLSKESDILSGSNLYFYQGFWVPETRMRSILSFTSHFQTYDNDLILASCPKSGTTWLKSLAFSIVNRHRFTFSNSPLLASNPHDLVPFIDVDRYAKYQPQDFTNMPQPRLLCTHTPYASLPSSMKNSNCRIVYIFRNPLDQFVSLWKFLHNRKSEQDSELPLKECFDMFCKGIHVFGPFWSHIQGFWKASIERPKNVLFLRYEDLKEDVAFQIKHLATFLGFPFTEEEEKQGHVEEISKLCSIEKMRSLKVNIDGKRYTGTLNSGFFRKGQVGDWRNYLTPSMTEHMEKLIREKIEDPNLVFKLSPKINN